MTFDTICHNTLLNRLLCIGITHTRLVQIRWQSFPSAQTIHMPNYHCDLCHRALSWCLLSSSFNSLPSAKPIYFTPHSFVSSASLQISSKNKQTVIKLRFSVCPKKHMYMLGMLQSIGHLLVSANFRKKVCDRRYEINDFHCWSANHLLIFCSMQRSCVLCNTVSNCSNKSTIEIIDWSFIC